MERIEAGPLKVEEKVITVDLVVIPAHDEESTVGNVVRAVSANLRPGSAEIVVVNDRSSDDTARMAEEAGAHVVHTRGQGGYGAAMHVRLCLRHRARVRVPRHHRRRRPARSAQPDAASGARAGGATSYPDRRYDSVFSPGVGAAPPDRVRVNREFTALINGITGR